MTTRLRAWREEHGLRLSDVADLTGLSVSHLSRVERGLHHAAPLTKVRVARRLGASISELFDPEDEGVSA